jgi:hypothetical protein
MGGIEPAFEQVRDGVFESPNFFYNVSAQQQPGDGSAQYGNTDRFTTQAMPITFAGSRPSDSQPLGAIGTGLADPMPARATTQTANQRINGPSILGD